MGDLGGEEIAACFARRFGNPAAEFAAIAILADIAADGQAAVFAPQSLEQTRGGAERRVERLVDAMFLENVCRDERQLVNGFTEFRGHASRSNGHEANSGDGGRNLHPGRSFEESKGMGSDMRENRRLAEFIVAAWRLANGPDDRMPTSHGILDRALEDLVREEAGIPAWVKENLTFADTRVGLRCLELPSILDCAQESFLTSEPNPTYASTAIKVDDLISRRMLRDLKIEQDDAVRWGKRLRKVTGDMVAEDSEHPVVVSTA